MEPYYDNTNRNEGLHAWTCKSCHLLFFNDATPSQSISGDSLAGTNYSKAHPHTHTLTTNVITLINFSATLLNFSATLLIPLATILMRWQRFVDVAQWIWLRNSPCPLTIDSGLHTGLSVEWSTVVLANQPISWSFDRDLHFVTEDVAS